MDYTVTVNEDDVSEIVRLSLEEMLSINLASGDDSEYTTALIAAMVVVHDYYSTKEQHEALLEAHSEELSRYDSFVEDWFDRHSDIVRKSGVSNLSVTDEDDGSATVSFDADIETINRLASKGVEYCVLREMLGGASASDILRWAVTGKKSEQNS